LRITKENAVIDNFAKAVAQFHQGGKGNADLKNFEYLKRSIKTLS